MQLYGRGGIVALAGYRGHHFQGYAVRLADGWTCVVALGMGWSRIPCRTAEDARVTLRTMSHAARFDAYRDVDDLIDVIHALPPFKQPGILPEQIAGLPAKLPRLIS